MLVLLLCSQSASAAGYLSPLFAAKEPISSYKKIQPLAEAGDPNAQNILGFMHFMGVGAEKDFLQAHDWFHLSAEQGYVVAQRNLGFMHSGAMNSVPAKYYDMEEANFWLGLVAVYARDPDTPQSAGLADVVDEYSEFIDAAGARQKGAQQLERGKNTYIKLCAGCHGFDGISNFRPAPSFALGERLEKNDSTLYSSILNGLGKMPSWQKSLSTKDITDVVYFIRAYFGGAYRAGDRAVRLSKAMPEATQKQSAAMVLGEETFQTFCVGCHGLNGVAFYVNSPSFALGERTNKSNAELKRSIMKGTGSMPGWEYMLSGPQIDALLLYLRRLTSRFDGFIDDTNWRDSSEFFFRFRPLGEYGKEWDDTTPGG